MFARLKTWEQMKQEYGLHSLYTINTPVHYLRTMEYCAPKDRIIELNNMQWIKTKFEMCSEMFSEIWETDPRIVVPETTYQYTEWNLPMQIKSKYAGWTGWYVMSKFNSSRPVFLQSDLSISSSIVPNGRFNNYQQALFAKHRYERLNKHLKLKD